MNKKNIFIINGSASRNSANEKLIKLFQARTENNFHTTICEDLKTFPHFDAELSIAQTPLQILNLRENIQAAYAVLFCTPEYIFSIPSGLKNLLEWCVSTTVFSNKPLDIITASASGEKGHHELQLIMRTLMAKFTDQSTLVISGIKGKLDEDGELKDLKTIEKVNSFIQNFITAFD